ncbi:hypothetical protein G7Y89_g5661 [Cudoniella acicularis]|uniref:Flavin-containing monooxygenase n=1 Tax=Cudoniella acicularis TaxID=354080 RepID=A0A8H4W3L4_9HELO|nr:hypothetical protein G7Y89_g5661 [Cudoniella acicularis]
MSEIEEFDLLIVGIGIAGLPMAKTYLQVNPAAKLLVLEANQSIGGTWAKERLYEGLQSNNLVGMLEFSDFPMDFETFGVAPGSHVPGTVLHRYLAAYAQRFGVYEKVRFGCYVKSAELKGDGSWEVVYEKKDEDGGTDEVKVVAKKMVLATGTTSGEDMEKSENVVVAGGSKSAADAVYMTASKGRHVDWVIRKSGRGAAWLSWPYVSPFKLQFEKLPTIRAMTLLSPCFDSPSSPIRYLLHNTRLGRALVRGFFSIIHNDMLTLGKFNDHPDTKKLIPPGNVFWSGTSVGIFNYPIDLFSLVQKGLINIHLADVTSLTPETVNLSDGTHLKADTVVLATGWKLAPSIKFLPDSLTSEEKNWNFLPPTFKSQSRRRRQRDFFPISRIARPTPSTWPPRRSLQRTTLLPPLPQLHSPLFHPQ